MPCYCGNSVNVMKPILSKVSKRKKPKKQKNVDIIRDELNKIIEQCKFNIPMQCMDKCQFPMPQSSNNLYTIDRSTYLEDMDPFWAEFLRKQHESGSTNIFNTKVYGPDKDPTRIQRSRFSSEIIHQRMLHMPTIGSLKRIDIYLMLTFILNLIQLTVEEQAECIEYLLENDVLNIEILNYMDIVAHHPNAGLADEEKNCLRKIIHAITHKAIRSIDTPYFNPDHIFKKSLIEIDPYELAYLKTIMHMPPDQELNKSQYMYLVNFIDLLQNMDSLQRNEALKILHKRGILPNDDFQWLIHYMEDRSKAFPFDTDSMKYVLKQFEVLLKLPPANDEHLYDASFQDENVKKPTKSCGPCAVDSDEPQARVQNLRLNIEQLHNTFNVLMNGSTNTGRIYELKQFIKKLLGLNCDDLEVTLAYLKDSYSIYIPEFQYTAEFIECGRMQGNRAKLNKLASVIRCIMKLPVGYKIPSTGYHCRSLPSHYQNRTKRKGKYDEDIPPQVTKNESEPSPQKSQLMAAKKTEEPPIEQKQKDKDIKESKAKDEGNKEIHSQSDAVNKESEKKDKEQKSDVAKKEKKEDTAEKVDKDVDESKEKGSSKKTKKSTTKSAQKDKKEEDNDEVPISKEKSKKSKKSTKAESEVEEKDDATKTSSSAKRAKQGKGKEKTEDGNKETKIEEDAQKTKKNEQIKEDKSKEPPKQETNAKEQKNRLFDETAITDDMYEDLYTTPAESVQDEDFLLFKGSSKPLPPPKAEAQEQDEPVVTLPKKDALSYFSDIASKRPKSADVRHFQPKSRHDIPLINFRMLFFHYCTREGPTNKLAAMKDGILILR